MNGNGYKKYGWVGNRIDDEDMRKLYKIKEKYGVPITEMVAEAVKEYIAKRKYNE